MLFAALIAVIVSMALVMIRGVVGKTLYDRILALNVFGTHTVAAVAILGFVTDTLYFIDVALTYALINFITTIALLRYFTYGTLGSADIPPLNGCKSHNPGEKQDD